MVLHRFLTNEEVIKVLNDCHSGAHGSHMSGRVKNKLFMCGGYFWSQMFHYFIDIVGICECC
jgi:hypothetical protein